MAYKDSETIQSGTSYALGEYSFNCVFDDSPTLGQYARASMTKDGQTVYKTVSLPNVSQIDGYRVEANEDVATVYAMLRVPTGDIEREYDGVVIPTSASITAYYGQQAVGPTTVEYESGCGCGYGAGYGGSKTLEASLTPLSYGFEYRIHEKTVYGRISNTLLWFPPVSGAYKQPLEVNEYMAAWIMIYGRPLSPEYELKEQMIGRFKIELEDAGGVGPGSDWIDPGDYNEDWEPGDPTYTLYVEIDGALSGRHNDPLNDTSYSYIPADKDTVKDYGCGGDGGHGGGGGAGASTVVVHKFATNQANSKEVTAIARRHGYGSGGGKGGKGGDGCILVYY